MKWVNVLFITFVAWSFLLSFLIKEWYVESQISVQNSVLLYASQYNTSYEYTANQKPHQNLKCKQLFKKYSACYLINEFYVINKIV